MSCETGASRYHGVDHRTEERRSEGDRGALENAE